MAKPIRELLTIPVAAQPTGGKGVALDLNGNLPSSVLPAIPTSLLTGTVATANLPTYTAYTPTWTATGTAPNIATNGATVTARYIQIGKCVNAQGKITFGSGGAFGTGDYNFALPVAARDDGTLIDMAGTAWLFDSSTSAFEQATVVQASSSSLMKIVYGATYLGTYTPVGQTAPWTWATSDRIHWNLTYEAA